MNLQQHNISDNNFEQCIKCTVCTVYCPVAAVNPDYPGPKQAGPDGERLRLKKFGFYDETLKYCINCKRCEVACPSNVKIGDIIQAARIKFSKKKPGVRDFILANTDLVGTLSTPVAPVVNATLGLKPVKAILDGVLKIDHRRTFPKYAFGTFESWYKKQVKEQLAFPKQVSYFHGCYVNYNYPQLGKDLVKVMNALGIGVRLLEKEKCCGVALISNGFIKQARKQADINIGSIRKSVVDKNIPVIATSSTCTFTIRDEYPHLLGVKNEDVREQVELATRYIYRLLSQETGGDMLAQITEPYDVLDSQCCGSAGTYGFKKENYKTSQDIGNSLFKQIEESGVDYVVTDCETCKWQIEMSTSKCCKHPISVLAEMLQD